MRYALPLRLVVLMVVIAGALAFGVTFGDRVDPQAIEASIRAFGERGALVFVACFALGTVLFLPGSLFGLAGGALFGPLWGAVWNLLGGTLGATVAFVVARHTGATWVAARTGGRLQRIVSGVEAEGWRFVALTRLVPVVPFNVLNYALGLTRIPLSHYVTATLVCMIPGTAAYAWLGYAGRAAIEGDGAAIRYGLLGLSALALIAFLPRLIGRLKKPAGWISVDDLKARLSGPSSPVIVDVRSPEEFIGPLGHIPGAINVPMSALDARLNEIVAVAARDIVFVCKTDKRSAQAAEVLRVREIRNVLVLRGGMEDWNKLFGAEYAVDQNAVRRWI